MCRLYEHIQRGQNEAQIKSSIIFLFQMTTENLRFYIKVLTALHIQARIIHDELYGVYGDEAPSLRTVERWSMLLLFFTFIKNLFRVAEVAKRIIFDLYIEKLSN